MAQFFQVHPDNPQARLINRSVDILLEGGVIVYPTDSSYALGCQIGEKSAMERIRRIRSLDDKHNFTLVCRDLSEITTYARIDNQAFRLLKVLTPGPYTFIFEGTKQVPRRLMHPRRKSIGIRVPDNAICRDLLATLDQPILSTTLILPDDGYAADRSLRDARAARSPGRPGDRRWFLRPGADHRGEHDRGPARRNPGREGRRVPVRGVSRPAGTHSGRTWRLPGWGRIPGILRR